LQTIFNVSKQLTLITEHEATVICDFFTHNRVDIAIISSSATQMKRR